MLFRHSFIVPFFLLLASFTLVSQEKRELTLEDCLDLSRNQNLSIQKSRISLETARSKAVNSWSYILPSLAASGSATYFSDSAAGSENPLLSADLTASLNLTSTLPLVVKANQLAYQREEISREQALFNLDCLVEQSFYELIAKERSLAIQKDHLELAGKEYDLVISDFVNGRIPEVSVFQSQVSYENMRPQYNQATIDYQNSLRTFLNVLGLELDTPVKLIGDLQIQVLKKLDPRDLIETYLYTRPDVQKTINDLENKKNNQLLTLMNKRLPQLSLSAQWETKNMVAEGALNEKIWPGSSSLTLGINIPLDSYIPGSQGDLSIKSAKADRLLQDLTLKETLKNGELQIYNAVDTLNNLVDSLKVSELRVEVAQVNYDLNDEGFRKGLIDQFDLENARINLLNAQQGHLDTQLKYKIALLNLSKAQNLTDRTALD